MAGRPSTYNAEITVEICRRLAEGETLRAICRTEGMPPESTVRLWALDDVGGFAARYARAREIGAYAMADALLEIADDGSRDTINTPDGPRQDHEWISRSRLRVDTRKWLASKILPKVFGDKVEVEQTVRRVISDEPLTEDEWDARYGAGVAPPGGTAEKPR